MTFHTVGQALRWYAKATAQADGLRAIWPDPKTLPQPPGQARDQEALLLTIWAIGDALTLVDPEDRELLFIVRVYGLPADAGLSMRGGRRADAGVVADWRVDRAERIVSDRLTAEGLLEANEWRS